MTEQIKTTLQVLLGAAGVFIVVFPVASRMLKQASSNEEKQAAYKNILMWSEVAAWVFGVCLGVLHRDSALGSAFCILAFMLHLLSFVTARRGEDIRQNILQLIASGVMLVVVTAVHLMHVILTPLVNAILEIQKAGR